MKGFRKTAPVLFKTNMLLFQDSHIFSIKNDDDHQEHNNEKPISKLPRLLNLAKLWKISLPSLDILKPSIIWSLWFRVWTTPCLIHFSDRSTLAEKEGTEQASMVPHCCLSAPAPASAWARLPGLSLVLPGLVISSDHSTDSVCYGQWQVMGYHFQGRLWHFSAQGQARARLSWALCTALWLLPASSFKRRSLAAQGQGSGCRVLGDRNSVLSSLTGWQRARQVSCGKNEFRFWRKRT